MKKHLLAASIAALLSGGALAATDLDTNSGWGGTYASEANVNATTGSTLGVGASADQEAKVKLGATLATDFVAYVRFDLSSGTFKADPTFAVDDSAAAAAIVNVAQGGAGESYVIFAVAPNAVGNNLDGSKVGTFNANDLTVKNQSTVALRYRLYETLTNAANQTLDLKDRSGSFIRFVNAIVITPGSTLTQTADVAETTGAYRKFLNPAGGANILEVPVASFTVAHNPAAGLLDGSNSAPGDILADTNDVTVNGDFTFVSQAGPAPFGSVTLDTSATCANAAGAGAVGASTLNNTQATFVNLSAVDITSAAWYVCTTANGSTPIPISSFSGGIDLDAQTGYTVNDGATGNGNIVRNGTILKAAFAETTGAAGMSSAVHLTNTSAAAAPYTVACVRNSGSVAGTAGSVPANTAVRYSLGGSLGCPTDGTLRGIELTFEAPKGAIIGSVVRQNTSTGQASFDGMIGNQ